MDDLCLIQETLALILLQNDVGRYRALRDDPKWRLFPLQRGADAGVSHPSRHEAGGGGHVLERCSHGPPQVEGRLILCLQILLIILAERCNRRLG